MAPVVATITVRLADAPPATLAQLELKSDAPAGRPLIDVIEMPRDVAPTPLVTWTVYVALLPAVTGFGACVPGVTAVIAAMAVIGTMRDTRIRSPWTMARARNVRRVYGWTVGTRFIFGSLGFGGRRQSRTPGR